MFGSNNSSVSKLSRTSRLSKTKKALVLGLCVLALGSTSEAASKKKRSAKARRAAAEKSASKKEKAKAEKLAAAEAASEPAQFEFKVLPEVLNSYTTIGQLTADLVRIGLATVEERSAIENFLVDRGVKLETPLEKMKFDSVTSTFRWSEINLAVQPDGTLKNSFGQILNPTGKTLDSNFGEAYLSFDRKTARARAMDLFLQEAHADTGATPAMRATGALTASIYGALKNLDKGTSEFLTKFGNGVAKAWNKLLPNNTVSCSPKGEFLQRKSSELTTPVDPHLLQVFYQPKPVPKCTYNEAAQMQVIVRAKGSTPEEKIKNAEIGKGYGPGADRNLDQEIAAANSRRQIRRVKAAQ